MNAFQDKTAIVTGGASGIGRALCIELAKRGALITVADINGSGAEEVARKIISGGGRASAVRVDVANKEELQALIHQIGRLDYMFNNAGFAFTGELRDTSEELWRKIVNINLWGVIHGSTAAYAVMLGQGSGHIVNTASAAGLLPIPMQAAYVTTKHAVVGFTKVLRAEAADFGIRVSVVCPGFIDTAMIRNSPVLNARLEDLEAKIPFRKYPAEKMAMDIIQGVLRNKAVILSPYYTRVLVKGYQLFPTLMEKTIGRKTARDFRSIRREP